MDLEGKICYMGEALSLVTYLRDHLRANFIQSNIVQGSRWEIVQAYIVLQGQDLWYDAKENKSWDLKVNKLNYLTWQMFSWDI